MSAFNTNNNAFLNNSDVGTLINYFKNVSGFQRSNRFRVDIDSPKGVSNNITLFANNVQVPAQVIIFYRDNMAPSGSNIDIPVKREYDERFLIEFIVDSGWQTRKFFDDWMNLMFKKGNNASYENSVYVTPWNDITSKVKIYPLDQNGIANKKITLYEAWPSTILPTQLMNDAPDDYLTLVVDMNYRYYEITPPDNN